MILQWPAPFSLVDLRRQRRGAVKGERKAAREKASLIQTLERMVDVGELRVIETRRGRCYYLPLQGMEDRLW